MDQQNPFESSSSQSIDLVGGPFAVLESDPGLFSILTRQLGAQGIQVVEIYDIAPWAVEHLSPQGLILCYPCNEVEQEEDAYSVTDTQDPDAEDVWFAYQISNDACASQALLNVILNLSCVALDAKLRDFRDFTERMSPLVHRFSPDEVAVDAQYADTQMKGLAVTNCDFIRKAHNAMARPADIRGALHATATSTLEYAKSSRATRTGAPPTKRRKRSIGSPRKSRPTSSSGELQDTYHFVGYVPAGGKVWELDGLRASGPLEIGELSNPPDPAFRSRDWMDIVRPAIKRKMERALTNQGDQLRYTLLAIVDDQYQKASDTLEMLKRERIQLERRLNEAYPNGWQEKVDASLVGSAEATFTTTLQPSALGRTFSREFASQKLEQDMRILDMPARNLPAAWETCVRAAQAAKVAVEDEIVTSTKAHTEHAGRTFDYELFLQTFVSCSQNEGLLEPILSSQR